MACWSQERDRIHPGCMVIRLLGSADKRRLYIPSDTVRRWAPGGSYAAGAASAPASVPKMRLGSAAASAGGAEAVQPAAGASAGRTAAAELTVPLASAKPPPGSTEGAGEAAAVPASSAPGNSSRGGRGGSDGGSGRAKKQPAGTSKKRTRKSEVADLLGQAVDVPASVFGVDVPDM